MNKAAGNETEESNEANLKEDLKKWDSDLLFSKAVESYLSFGFNKCNKKGLKMAVESFEIEVENSTSHFSLIFIKDALNIG